MEQKIIEEFKDSSKQKNRIVDILITIYMIFSIAIFWIVPPVVRGLSHQ